MPSSGSQRLPDECSLNNLL